MLLKSKKETVLGKDSQKQDLKSAKKELRAENRKKKQAEKLQRTKERAKENVLKESNFEEGKGKKRTVKERFLHSRLFDHLWILNPQNLALEVHVYGYNFSWKRHILLMLCSVLGISTIGIVFKLNPSYFVASIVLVLTIIPNAVRYTYRQMYEQKRFADVVTYMVQMLYSFQKNGKILASLGETSELFQQGTMKSCIEDAITYIQNGETKGEGGLYREALSIIEEKYDCVKLLTVHGLLVNSEAYGGDNENSLMILLKDVENWKKRGYHLQLTKKRAHTDNVISIVVSTMLCAVILYVLNYTASAFPGMSTGADIFKIGIIQISSILFIAASLYIYMKSMRFLTTNWLQTEEDKDEKLLMSDYETVVGYDESVARKKSYIYAAPFAIGAVAALAFQINWAGIICIILAVFMLMQHKVGYNIAMKNVNEALYQAMPQWFMQMALLLQHNNVQVSLALSIEDAPMLLKPELIKLMERLSDAPNKLTSYTDFCKAFDVPEALSCMKMLHAITESGAGDAKKQINNLIERVNEMQDAADAIKNQHLAYLMKTVFSLPVGAATVKLMIDFTFGVVTLSQMISVMGGV